MGTFTAFKFEDVVLKRWLLFAFFCLKNISAMYGIKNVATFSSWDGFFVGMQKWKMRLDLATYCKQ